MRLLLFSLDEKEEIVDIRRHKQKLAYLWGRLKMEHRNEVVLGLELPIDIFFHVC